MFGQNAAAQTYTVLYSFTGGPDGGNPASRLVRDGAGNLYGTTVFGGASNPACSNGSCGVVFKLDPSGRETVLHTFAGPPTDGANPHGGVVLDSAGNLYGTTQNGGSVSNGSCFRLGCGVIFEIDPTGKETVLYNFAGAPADGASPQASLVRDSAGNLYGTTFSGGLYAGIGQCGDAYFSGCGVIFKLDAAGMETVLHNFTGGVGGSSPYGSLIRDSAGSLYGTAYTGGNGQGVCRTFEGNRIGCGVVFKLDPLGKETVLHTFTGFDGKGPYAGVIRDAAGNLYGTTELGGSLDTGVVFKLDVTGKETTVSNPGGGAYYEGSLIRDAAGNLYGTAFGGGLTGGTCSTGCGVIFKLDPTGQATTLHTFTGGAQGGSPIGGLIRDEAGNFYGTTELGGLSNSSCYSTGCGVVYKLTP
jgi:uncharacterized repeat protein (TIGR03803 family)